MKINYLVSHIISFSEDIKKRGRGGEGGLSEPPSGSANGFEMKISRLSMIRLMM